MYNRREATPVNGKIHAAPRREERRNHYTRKNCCLHREDDVEEKLSMVEAHMSEKKRASCLGDTLYIMESYSSSIKK